MIKKKAIILQHSGGELANQLWNYISIYAFTLEHHYECDNPSFFEYSKYFPNTKPNNFLIKTFFYLPFLGHNKRRNSLYTRFFRFLYKLIVLSIKKIHKNKIITTRTSCKEEVIYLPPTTSENFNEAMAKKNKIYFDGWLFRNPAGIKKYRNEILDKFKTTINIDRKTNKIIGQLKNKYNHIIGVHIRQGDYKTFKNGKYLIDQQRVANILKEYLLENGFKKEEVIFFIASDGKIEINIFSDLNIYISNEDASVDLFCLSKTEIIIGSDSSFGDIAAYFGNIPHVILKKEKIDWGYYKNKNTFFENKYCSMVNY